MNRLKYLIMAFIGIDLILVFPIMLSYDKVGAFLNMSSSGLPEVFVTLIVEITLLVATSVLAYLASRILKGTPLQSALYLIAWGVLMYGVGDSHLLVWMYTGVEGFPYFFGPKGSSIAHAFSVGLGFILVILGLYKIAMARKHISSNETVG